MYVMYQDWNQLNDYFCSQRKLDVTKSLTFSVKRFVSSCFKFFVCLAIITVLSFHIFQNQDISLSKVVALLCFFAWHGRRTGGEGITKSLESGGEHLQWSQKQPNLPPAGIFHDNWRDHLACRARSLLSRMLKVLQCVQQNYVCYPQSQEASIWPDAFKD